MDKGHVLGFVLRGKTVDENVGIKAFPKQTYGVSEESPDWFKKKHSLISENGYIYKWEHNPEYYYASQKKSFNLHKCIE